MPNGLDIMRARQATTRPPEPKPEPAAADDQNESPTESAETGSESGPEKGPEQTPANSPRGGSSSPGRVFSGPIRVGSDGAGLVLGLLFWGWVVVPYLKNGKQGVKDVLSAKFLNRKGGVPIV